VHAHKKLLRIPEVTRVPNVENSPNPVTLFVTLADKGVESLGYFPSQANKARGRCYDHNFLRFLPIAGEKNNVMINFVSKTSNSLSRKRQYFCQNFRRTYFKKHNIGPWSHCAHWLHASNGRKKYVVSGESIAVERKKMMSPFDYLKYRLMSLPH
jgi:hypothetical protein